MMDEIAMIRKIYEYGEQVSVVRDQGLRLRSHYKYMDSDLGLSPHRSGLGPH